jgi:hypothetical protein
MIRMTPRIPTGAACAALLLLASLAAIAEDRFVAGGTVRQSESVSGDLVSFGGDVELAASVDGDAVLGGGNVKVGDEIARDLYAGGGNVVVEGVVARNARLAGGNVDVQPTARIGGRLSIAGGSVTIRGPVGGSIEVAAGDVMIDSEVGGDVRVAAGSLALGPNARIGGRLLHQGWVDVKRDPAAVVAGGIVRRDPSRERHMARASSFATGWGWSAAFIALAALLVGVFPALATRLGVGVRQKPGLAFFLGFIVLACVPVAALVIGITIIGIPVALVLLLGYALLLVLGYASAGVLIGDAALARLRGADATRLAWRAGAAAAAALALALLGRVPLVGWLIGLAAIVAGIGAIAVAIHDRHSRAAAA